MAQRQLRKSVELKPGEHGVIELGELQPGEQLVGHVKDANHDTFLFAILDEKNFKRFMEGEEEYEGEEEGLEVIEEGDGKGHYEIDAPVVGAGKYYLVVESTAAALKRTIKVNLTISGP